MEALLALWFLWCQSWSCRCSGLTRDVALRQYACMYLSRNPNQMHLHIKTLTYVLTCPKIYLFRTRKTLTKTWDEKMTWFIYWELEKGVQKNMMVKNGKCYWLVMLTLTPCKLCSPCALRQVLLSLVPLWLMRDHILPQSTAAGWLFLCTDAEPGSLLIGTLTFLFP